MTFNFDATDDDDGYDLGIPTNVNKDDSLLGEAERRFAKAKYYEVLIKEPIFDGDDTPCALEVIGEIQTFARERLSVLLGIIPGAKSDVDSNPFSAEEVEILKKMAAKLLKKPELAGLQNEPSSPTLKRAVAPKAPALKQVKTSRQAPPAQNAGAKKDVASSDPKQMIKIPQKDGTVRSYRKVSEAGHDVYIGENGLRYSLATNDSGEYFMKCITAPARPVGHMPAPPLNDAGIAMVAARHAQAATRQGTIVVGGADLGSGTSESGSGLAIATLVQTINKE